MFPIAVTRSNITIKSYAKRMMELSTHAQFDGKAPRFQVLSIVKIKTKQKNRTKYDTMQYIVPAKFRNWRFRQFLDQTQNS